MMNIDILKKLLKNRRFGENITISKRIMKNVPQECEETILGDLYGAYRQYRCDSNIHILEYTDKFLVHKDRFDPRRDPFAHLIYDSPEILLALGIGSTLGISVGEIIYKIIKNKTKNPIFKAAIAGILTATISGIFIYYIGKELKNL